MTLSLAGTRRDAGVSIAEVNLKLIWDVVSKIKVGDRGQAYVVDARGRLIAHPDISLVLRNTDMTRLAQVQAAQRGVSGVSTDEETAVDIQGRQVLAAFAPVAPLGWTVFVELPVDEAYQPLIASMERSILVLLGALCLAALAGIFLARRMVVQIHACERAQLDLVAVTCRNVFLLKRAMNSRHLPISSTIWPDGWRNPTPA